MFYKETYALLLVHLYFHGSLILVAILTGHSFFKLQLPYPVAALDNTHH